MTPRFCPSCAAPGEPGTCKNCGESWSTFRDECCGDSVSWGNGDPAKKLPRDKWLEAIKAAGWKPHAHD